MNHPLFMRRCFDLAQLGAGYVSPNPMVGAVLVHEGKIIGEGWHQKWGEAHAEVHCLRSVLPENQHLIPYSTLYCSLEPCFHFGKTPPCVNLVLEHNIPRVVIANVDPNPKVAGQSIEKMRAAGVEVISGILEEEGAWLNRSFMHWIRQQRPYVVLKWAQSADGFIGRQGERTAISGPSAQRLVHRWRSEADAILVGTSTAIIDNPKLDARLYGGKNPLRIVFDLEKKIPAEYNIIDDSIETWVFGPQRSGSFQRTQFFPSGDKIQLEGVLSQLRQNNRATLLVEGGAKLLQQFLEKGLWDEIRVIESAGVLGGGVQAPALPPDLVLREVYSVGQDKVTIYAIRSPS